MTYVKICGITNLADARLALEEGADLLGFNFYEPSPRFVAPSAAAPMITALRSTHGAAFRVVGVFVNAPLEQLQEIERECALDLVQLHGDEPLEYCASLGNRAYKALRPRSAQDARTVMASFGTSARVPTRGNGAVSSPRFLIDASHPKLYGGTGSLGDWGTAREIAAQHPILLAGGLNPANVAAAIQQVQPWGVDVASGVERAPGLKDPEKVRAFVRAAKAA